MSQNTQQYPRMGTDLQSLPAAHGNDPLALVDTLKIVACSVCRAVYIPSCDQQDQCTAVLLETAFLDVCHACFRCQRPACPQCWNPIHHTCASCCEEAHLPFRGPVPSLEGLVFLPLTTSPHPAQTHNISFFCQRNGRFYSPESAPAEPASQEISVKERVTSDALPALQLDPVDSAPAPVINSSYPVWLQEVLGRKTDEQPAPSLVNPEQLAPSLVNIRQPVRNVTTTSAPPEVPLAWSQTSQTYWPQMAPTGQPQAVPPEPPRLPVMMQQPAPVLPAPTPESQSEATPQDQETNEEISLLERIENALIVLTSILLLAVVLMIVLSICFAQVNTFFLTLVHIDIRTEIAYLLQLR
jgi:hypothetical protein